MAAQKHVPNRFLHSYAALPIADNPNRCQTGGDQSSPFTTRVGHHTADTAPGRTMEVTQPLP
jgi:hypothetical protein